MTDDQIFPAGHPQVSKGLPTHKNAQVKKLARELEISAKRIEDWLPLLALPPDLARLVGTPEMSIEKAEILARLHHIARYTVIDHEASLLVDAQSQTRAALLALSSTEAFLRLSVDQRRKECLLIHYPLLELASPEAQEITSERFWAEDDRTKEK